MQYVDKLLVCKLLVFLQSLWKQKPNPRDFIGMFTECHKCKKAYPACSTHLIDQLNPPWKMQFPVMLVSLRVIERLRPVCTETILVPLTGLLLLVPFAGLLERCTQRLKWSKLYLHYCEVCITARFALLQDLHYCEVCITARFALLQGLHYCKVTLRHWKKKLLLCKVTGATIVQGD